MFGTEQLRKAISEYQVRQLNQTTAAFNEEAHHEVELALARSPQPSNNHSNGVLIDELLGPADGPYRVNS